MTSPDPRTRSVAAVLYRGGEVSARRDLLAVEDPLEIRVVTADAPEPRRLSMTMRTPGDDADLAAGFLYTEGIVRSREQIADITCSEDHVRVDLAAGVRLPEAVPKRSFVMTSACGVCGRASLDNLRAQPGPADPGSPPARRHGGPRPAGRAAAGAGDLHRDRRDPRGRPVRPPW
ncbi:formate dehydrogenase accessory sulfurtransferase FdhD [Nannocystis pusilla]|uniref:formate dehydrogenase accessory sulfurtransferase FdhD n=1 Tax=Nannocystis pusilla TaxID=889268 RepID=UPI003B820ACF